MTVRSVRRRLAMGLTHGWLSVEERAALPATAGWRRRRLIELVRTVEIGPFAVAREPGVIFIVEIFKDLEREKKFFPIVWRRGFYRITPSFANRPANKQLDVIEPRFAPEAFTRASEAAALESALRKIRDTFDAGEGRRKRQG